MITTVVDLDRGDCGKGRISDLLGEKCSMFIKPNGSGNAGHTIKIKDEIFKLHHIPAGVLRPGVKCLLSSGMVINPVYLLDEIYNLETRGIDTSNIFISGAAHINLPLYSLIDEKQENNRKISIGTTKKGNGVAYSLKHSREGFRFFDIPDFLNGGETYDKIKEKYLEFTDEKEASMEMKILEETFSKIQHLVVDSRQMVRNAVKNKEDIIIETSQGAYLDIDEGQYPFVTSTCTTATTSCLGTSIGIREINRIYGVFKAYSTYVGNGSFVAEAEANYASYLREKGGEFGTTTGRPRRCGYLEIPVIKNSIELNSCTQTAMTKLDVLSGLEKIKVVKSYILDGEEIDYVPLNAYDYARCIPIYEEFPGWEEDISDVNDFYSLPKNAQSYIEAIIQLINQHIDIVSVGPERNQFFIL